MYTGYSGYTVTISDTLVCRILLKSAKKIGYNIKPDMSETYNRLQADFANIRTYYNLSSQHPSGLPKDTQTMLLKKNQNKHKNKKGKQITKTQSRQEEGIFLSVSELKTCKNLPFGLSLN